MKKLTLFLMALATTFALHAQWVDDPATNTFIVNASDDATEIYLSSNDNTGDTYVQWLCFASNGWSPTLQRLNFAGEPLWGPNGIHIGGHEFSSSSDGIAMVTTADGGVVSCFAVYDGYIYAVKINADGTFAWGEQGIQLFDGQGFSRTELVAGTDGGVWALGADYNQSYIQYIHADGTLSPTNTISSNKKCWFGQLTLSKDNKVFLTYEKTGSQIYTDKEIHLVGFNPDGTQFCDDIVLMDQISFYTTYIHHVVPDGLGGGYAYLWHGGLGNFNVYVMHFDQNGISTISDPYGATVHSADPGYYYLDAYATVDPLSHDLIVAFQQIDATTQTQNWIYVNRITSTGERVWDEGILVADYTGNNFSEVKVDAFEDGSGFVVIYDEEAGLNSQITKAKGFDSDGNSIWSTTLSSTGYNRIGCENTSGFHGGQDIVIWTNASTGGLYGQNIMPTGNMGPMPQGCLGPKNFQGEYVYDDDSQTYGVLLTWDEPAEEVEYYRLYRTDIETEEETVIEFAGGVTSYFDAAEIGQYKYQLRALYAYLDCGFSEPATTPEGYDYVIAEVTGIEENESNEIVTITRIFNASGQAISNKSLAELSNGLYILQGLNHNGNLVTRKMVINH